MRIVLTGCSGYIGSRLAPRLAAAGHEIIGIDRAPLPSPLPLARFIQTDLLEPPAYATALEGADLICHLAAAKGDWGISAEEYARDNVEATRSLIGAAEKAGCGRWIFYSTVSVLGPSEAPLSEQAPRRAINDYGESKARAEELYEAYAARRGAQIINIRPSVVYGPENPWNTNVYRLTDAIWRNRFLMIGRGREVKTTSYIDNLLDAHMFLLERAAYPAEGKMDPYHYVDEPACTTAGLVAAISAKLGKKAPSIRLPLAVASPLALVGDAAAALTGLDLPITSARVRKFCTATNFSSEKIRRLGFVQRWSNDEALQATVDWYLTTHASRPVRVKAA